MVLGLDGYTLVHVAISFIGIGAGFIVLGGFLADARLDGAVHTYFAMAVATDVTGAKRKVQNSSKYGKTTQATETAYPSITDAYLTPVCHLWAHKPKGKGVQTMHQLRYLLAASLVLVSSAALAQEKYDTAPLPAICTKGAKTAMDLVCWRNGDAN